MPLYVSEDAYRYAFSSDNIRFIALRKDTIGLEASKYLLTRKKEKSFIDIKAKKSFDLKIEKDKKLFALFCEQIDIAYLDLGYGNITIPFTINNLIKVNLRGLDLYEYFKTNIIAVESELFDIETKANCNLLKLRLHEMGY